MMPLVGFLPADDGRVRGTIEAIERELLSDGFVHRYAPDPEVDGLPGGEGVFLLCTFWLADCLALIGRHDDARSTFERLLSIRNDVGLLSEMYDPAQARMLGNFPQAFSHVGLVNTALNLRRGSRGRHRNAAEVNLYWLCQGKGRHNRPKSDLWHTVCVGLGRECALGSTLSILDQKLTWKTIMTATAEKSATKLSDYEQAQVEKIASWKASHPNPFGELFHRATRPVAKLVELIIPDRHRAGSHRCGLQGVGPRSHPERHQAASGGWRSVGVTPEADAGLRRSLS